MCVCVLFVFWCVISEVNNLKASLWAVVCQTNNMKTGIHKQNVILIGCSSTLVDNKVNMQHQLPFTVHATRGVESNRVSVMHRWTT